MFKCNLTAYFFFTNIKILKFFLSQTKKKTGLLLIIRQMHNDENNQHTSKNKNKL